MVVDGIEVIFETDECSIEDIRAAVDDVCSKHNKDSIEYIVMCNRDGFLGYRGKLKKFARIRRITGYLVGDTNTWNDAKAAELADRVKHG
jgi:anaerobic ribonucleoside-triphosphate reductase